MTGTFVIALAIFRVNDENLKHEIELLKKTNESLAVKEIKNEIEQLLLNISMENFFTNTETAKPFNYINLLLTYYKD